jgi:hypothetical protein
MIDFTNTESDLPTRVYTLSRRPILRSTLQRTHDHGKDFKILLG